MSCPYNVREPHLLKTIFTLGSCTAFPGVGGLNTQTLVLVLVSRGNAPYNKTRGKFPKEASCNWMIT